MKVTFWGAFWYVVWIVVFLAAVNFIAGNVISAVSVIP